MDADPLPPVLHLSVLKFARKYCVLASGYNLRLQLAKQSIWHLFLNTYSLSEWVTCLSPSSAVSSGLFASDSLYNMPCIFLMILTFFVHVLLTWCFFNERTVITFVSLPIIKLSQSTNFSSVEIRYSVLVWGLVSYFVDSNSEDLQHTCACCVYVWLQRYPWILAVRGYNTVRQIASMFHYKNILFKYSFQTWSYTQIFHFQLFLLI